MGGTNGLLRFNAPMPEAIFFANFSICTFHDKFSSIKIPMDFVKVTCFIGIASMAGDGCVLNVPNFCLDPMSINSVLYLKLK